MRVPFAVVAAVLAGAALAASGAHAVDLSVDPRNPDVVTVNERARFHYEYRRQSSVAPEARLSEYVLARLCNVNSQFLEPEIDGECAPSNGTVNPPGCGDDEPVRPLWHRSRPTTAAPWSRWEMVVGWICPADLLPVITQEEFRRLLIEPLPAFRQPSSQEVLVNKPLIVYTEPASQTFRTSVFDFGIDVVATPREYTWDFGDASEPLHTASAGAPYPEFDITHTYARPLTATVTLTTTWTGRYRVDDPHGAWSDVNGTAVTTTTLDPFEVIELRSRLTGD